MTDFKVKGGVDFIVTWVVTEPVSGLPLNLGDGSYRVFGQVRESVDSPQVLHEWDSLSPDSGGLVLENGQLTVKLRGSTSSLIAESFTRVVYQLLVINLITGDVIEVDSGSVTLARAIARLPL